MGMFSILITPIISIKYPKASGYVMQNHDLFWLVDVFSLLAQIQVKKLLFFLPVEKVKQPINQSGPNVSLE